MIQSKRQCPCRLARRAQQLHEQGENREAYDLICRAPLSPGGNPGLWFLRVKLGMAARQWHQALIDLEALMEVVTPRPPLVLARIECFVSLGRVGEALSLIRNHGHSMENSCGRFILEARIDALRNRPDGVINCLEKAMELDPEIATGLAFSSPELAPWAIGAMQSELKMAIAG